MQIRYKGNVQVRIVENYRWDASNAFLQEVSETELAATLLMEPEENFVCLGADETEIAALANVLGADMKQTRDWLKTRTEAQDVRE